MDLGLQEGAMAESTSKYMCSTQLSCFTSCATSLGGAVPLAVPQIPLPSPPPAGARFWVISIREADGTVRVLERVPVAQTTVNLAGLEPGRHTILVSDDTNQVSFSREIVFNGR